MEIRKESEVIERISELTGKPKSTLYDWKKSEKNIKVYEALEEYVKIKDIKEDNRDLNDKDFLIGEINKALIKLPNHKAKKFYYLIMAELAEFE